MAVRQFTGTNVLDTAVGAMGAATHGTYAAIVKRGSTGAWDTILAQHTSGGSAINQFAFDAANNIVLWIPNGGTETSSGPAWNNTSDWALIVVRKATGTAAPRFSVYNFTTDTWTHANGSAARPNWDITTGGTIRFRWGTVDHFTGLVAIRAGWANSLPWLADASGDAAIEAAGLELSAANWDAASPNMGQLFNQAATTTAVEDWTGNGADETAITGTAVVTDDDPPGFDFSLTPSGETVTLAGTLPALTGSFDIASSADAALSGTLPALAADFSVAAEADVQFGGTLPALTGSFTIEAPGTVTLSGLLPALQGSFTIAGGDLVNLDFVALAPVFAHGAATTPEFRDRMATTPEFRQRVATSPEFGHGDPGEPTT